MAKNKLLQDLLEMGEKGFNELKKECQKEDEEWKNWHKNFDNQIKTLALIYGFKPKYTGVK